MENNIKIIVLGRNYTSLLGMVRAVSTISNDITVIRSISKSNNTMKSKIKKLLMGKGVSESSKYIKKYDYTIEPNKEMLIEKIIKENDQKKQIIILPTDDFTASTIDLYQKKFPKNYLFPNINHNPGKIVELMDKSIQKKLTDKCGLTTSNSWIINYEKGKITIPNNIKYPVFIKPLISFTGTKEIMKKCDNESDIKNILNKLSKNIICPILAEEYINIEKEYAILGCSYNGTVIMPAIIEMLESGEGAHKGVTLKGKVTEFDRKNTLYKNLEKFIIETKLNGLFDIDLYESNGKYYFNELNLRFGASGYAITKSGVNLPKLFVQKLLNINSNDKINVKIENKIFINEKVNLEKYKDGFIKNKEYKENINSANICFIKCLDDKKPYKTFKKQEIITRIKKTLHRG